MAKINFTKEHYAKMRDLAVEMLIHNCIINTPIGQSLNIVELMHTQTIGILNNIRVSLGKKIESMEQHDEWVATDNQQGQLEKLKRQKELVNLIIGWKRYKMEQFEISNKRAELSEKLERLKESQKTPEDRIKEIEAELSSLNSEEF